MRRSKCSARQALCLVRRCRAAFLGVGCRGCPAVDHSALAWKRLEVPGRHFSLSSPPCHVPSRLRQTLPSASRAGTNNSSEKKGLVCRKAIECWLVCRNCTGTRPAQARCAALSCTAAASHAIHRHRCCLPIATRRHTAGTVGEGDRGSCVSSAECQAPAFLWVQHSTPRLPAVLARHWGRQLLRPPTPLPAVRQAGPPSLG